MKYKANYMTSNGTHMCNGIEGNNKRALAYDIREIAKGNVLKGEYANWDVSDNKGNIVIQGFIR